MLPRIQNRNFNHNIQQNNQRSYGRMSNVAVGFRGANHNRMQNQRPPPPYAPNQVPGSGNNSVAVAAATAARISGGLRSNIPKPNLMPNNLNQQQQQNLATMQFNNNLAAQQQLLQQQIDLNRQIVAPLQSLANGLQQF